MGRSVHKTLERLSIRAASLAQHTANTGMLIFQMPQKYKLIDTAGIRRRAAVASAGSTTETLSVKRAFSAIRRSDVVALVIEAMACVSEQVFISTIHSHARTNISCRYIVYCNTVFFFAVPRIIKLQKGLRKRERHVSLLWTNGTQSQTRTMRVLHIMNRM